MTKLISHIKIVGVLIAIGSVLLAAGALAKTVANNEMSIFGIRSDVKKLEQGYAVLPNMERRLERIEDKIDKMIKKL